MSMTAFEQNRHLHINLGDDTEMIVPPIPGATGRELLGLLVSVSFGSDLGNAEANAQRLARLSLGLPVESVKLAGETPRTLPPVEGMAEWAQREKLFNELRASEQERVSQAAILWNVQGGSIDAVHDLLNTEAGEAYPKALGRVMRSCGLGQQFEALRTWLSGASENQTSTASTADTTTPTGGTSTDASALNDSAETGPNQM